MRKIFKLGFLGLGFSLAAGSFIGISKLEREVRPAKADDPVIMVSTQDMFANKVYSDGSDGTATLVDDLDDTYRLRLNSLDLNGQPTYRDASLNCAASIYAKNLDRPLIITLEGVNRITPSEHATTTDKEAAIMIQNSPGQNVAFGGFENSELIAYGPNKEESYGESFGIYADHGTGLTFYKTRAYIKSGDADLGNVAGIYAGGGLDISGGSYINAQGEYSPSLYSVAIYAEKSDDSSPLSRPFSITEDSELDVRAAYLAYGNADSVGLWIVGDGTNDSASIIEGDNTDVHIQTGGATHGNDIGIRLENTILDVVSGRVLVEAEEGGGSSIGIAGGTTGVKVRDVGNFVATGYTTSMTAKVTVFSSPEAYAWASNEYSQRTVENVTVIENESSALTDADVSAYKRFEVNNVIFSGCSDVNTTFDGENHHPFGDLQIITPNNITEKEECEITWYVNDDPTAYHDFDPVIKFAGDYSYEAVLKGPDFYCDAAFGFSYNIAKANITNISVSQSTPLTYDGTAQTVSLSRSATTVGGETANFLFSRTSSGEFTNVIPTFTDAGEHTAYYKVTADSHNDSEVKSFVVIIGKAELTGVSASQKGQLVYNGQAQRAEVQTSAIAVGDNQVTFLYSTAADGDFDNKVPAFTEVGEHTVYYKATANNHNDSEVKSFTVTIVSPKAPGKGGLPGGAIVGIVLGSLVLALGGAYAILFFLCNKWIKDGDKALRVFPFAFGKKGDQVTLFAFPFKFVSRPEAEVYKTKDEALR